MIFFIKTQLLMKNITLFLLLVLLACENKKATENDTGYKIKAEISGISAKTTVYIIGVKAFPL